MANEPETNGIIQASEDEPAKQPVNRKSAHVLLTPRDIDLMVSLHDHVVLSFAQIQRRHFAGRSAATVMNRLKRIEVHGLIERIRVPRLHIVGSDHATGVVFQLSNRGRSVLSKYRPMIHIFEKCPTINPHQLDHDLLIVDIAAYFRSRHPYCRWTNGRYLTALDGVNKIPDAVLQRPGSDTFIAIELELNGKSTRRYREIVAMLRASRHLEKVIFVTSSTSIGRKIMSAIEGFNVPERHVFRSDLFEFVRLSECLKANGR